MSFTDTGPDFDTAAREKDGAHPRFYMDTRQNKALSEKEGRPVFDDVEMVEVLIPGDRLNTPVFQVRDDHRKRWPKAYAAFRANQEAPLEGTPLDQLPGMTKGRVQELLYFHVHTIEQLAGMPDDLLMKAAPMDGRALRDKALRWVSATEGSAADEKLAAENRELREKMATMEQNSADLLDRLKGLEAREAAAAAKAT